MLQKPIVSWLRGEPTTGTVPRVAGAEKTGCAPLQFSAWEGVLP